LVEQEPLLAADFLRRLLERLLPDPDSRAQDHEQLDGGAVRWSEVVDRLRTYSWFGGFRVIEVRSAQRCKDPDLEPLERYLAAPVERALLILRWDESAREGKLSRLIEQRGQVKRFETPGPAELLRWVKGYLQREQIAIDEQAALRLVEITEGDLHRLKGELEKLVAYFGASGATVRNAELGLLLGDHRGVEIFELLEALLDRDRSRAPELLRRYLTAGGELLPLIGLILRNLESAQLAGGARAAGASWPAALQRARVPYPAHGRTRKMVEQWGVEGLERLLRGLHQIDVGLKSGAQHSELELELLMLLGRPPQ
jgi:DNA polymerase III delta subunit